MIRGIECRRIFDNYEDRVDFIVDLGMSMVDVARRLGITPAEVSYSVQRGEKTAKEEDYQLELMKLLIF